MLSNQNSLFLATSRLSVPNFRLSGHLINYNIKPTWKSTIIPVQLHPLLECLHKTSRRVVMNLSIAFENCCYKIILKKKKKIKFMMIQHKRQYQVESYRLPPLFNILFLYINTNLCLVFFATIHASQISISIAYKKKTRMIFMYNFLMDNQISLFFAIS